MEEQIFFKDDKITISKSLLSVDKQSFALDAVSAIRIEEIPANKRTPENLMIVGALLLFFDALFFIIGLLTLAGSAFFWKMIKPKYSIVLSTAAGEKQVIIGNDKDYAEQIFSVLNQALSE